MNDRDATIISCIPYLITKKPAIVCIHACEGKIVDIANFTIHYPTLEGAWSQRFSLCQRV